jgi:hypothetical protein
MRSGCCPYHEELHRSYNLLAVASSSFGSWQSAKGSLIRQKQGVFSKGLFQSKIKSNPDIS